MRLRILLALALALALAVWPAAPASANTSFTRSCSVTGGSAQSLSGVLTACGYAGVLSLQELSVKDPDAAANSVYVGQSDVSAANGYELAPGDSKTWRATNQGDMIEAGRLYLFVATTQNVMISLRSK